MKKSIKRIVNWMSLLMVLSLAALFILADAQKVSADTKTASADTRTASADTRTASADTKAVSAETQKEKPYFIKVNRVYNTITIYEKDEEGKYTVPIKAMICSVGKSGTQTTLGTFQTKAKYRWKELMGDVYGQYSTRIVGGILFHSVYYYQNGNPATLATKEYNKLGNAASHGCIRLTVEDAKWIYDNCAVGTTVVIYDDKKSPGPLGKPIVIKLPSNVRWDPTDPSSKNPYRDKLPQIAGAKNIKVNWGETVDLLQGMKAKSIFGVDITSRLSVEGEIDIYTPGKYQVTYSVVDELGRTGKKSVTVTVGESKTIPELTGISDKTVGADVIINEEYALSGVELYCSGILLNKDQIEITIEKITELEYRITYYIYLGKNATTTQSATIYVDQEAPMFYGIMDRVLQFGETLNTEYALRGVTVSDNYTSVDNITIAVVINDNLDGSHTITYIAEDEFGNVAEENAIIQNTQAQSVINN